MTALLSVDPGIRGCGCALWNKGVLVFATYVNNPAAKGGGPAECAKMAHAIVAWVRRDFGDLERVICEWPQTYGGGASRGDTNDLFPVAGVGAALAALVEENVRFDYVVPHDWKGSIQKPKKVSDPYPIVLMCERRLSDVEKDGIELPGNKRHHWDVWDAVGIGLKALDRFEKMRAIARE